MAQNTDSIEAAKDLSVYWEDDHYNVLGVRTNREVREELGRDLGSVDPNINYILMSYRSLENIKPYRISGDQPSDIRILGYKIDGIPRFTSLLNL